MQKIVPFLWFDHQAEEAANFYTSLFTNSQVGAVTRLHDVPGPEGQAMTVAFQLAGQDFMALNGGPEFAFTPAVSFFVSCENEQQIDLLWQHLSAGGQVLMPLEAYDFSTRYGWVADRYGVNWQLMLNGQPQAIAPALMFTGDQFGRAEEAMELYTEILPDSRINEIARYLPGEGGGAEGKIKYASFTLAGQDFVANESNYNHGFGFTPAISFYINCDTQQEVDHYWERLLEGGEPEQCGWLKDKFGVSWQVVPTILGEMLSGPDPERAQRVTQAMLQMVKLDIAQLQQAYDPQGQPRK